MRFLNRFWFVLLPVLCWGCFPKRQNLPQPAANLPAVELTAPERSLEQEAEKIAAKLLETDWLRNQKTLPVILLGKLEHCPKSREEENYTEALGRYLLNSGKVILVQSRGMRYCPEMPTSDAQADSMVSNCGAKWFAQSLMDGPDGQQRLILRIYLLPELQLVESVSCEIDKN